MKLVEVISGLATAPEAAARGAELAAAWGKTIVYSAATPGFIVNRIARPFYAEAWRLQGEGAAAPDVIDAMLTGAGGFRMGLFALMDLIGHDVNEAVTRSVWAAFGHDSRFKPSLAQRALVEAGWLGRKTGRGCYFYESGTAPAAEPAAGAGPPAALARYGEHALRSLLAGTPVTAGDPDGCEPTRPAAWRSCRAAPCSPGAAGRPPPRCRPRPDAR
jgi:3-hydroxybutyryl-CoA dehydrogenase